MNLLRALPLAFLLWTPQAARAAHPLVTPAPEFPADAAWFNSEPFTLQRLKGRRVTVVTFLNANSPAALRVLPSVRSWWERYALDGLMVIGVYTPDYAFARDPAWVRGMLKRLGIRFPVVMDSKRALWKDYHNEGWPAHYLLDEKGRIIFDRLGEGGEPEFEREILAAVERFNSFRSSETVADLPQRDDCGQATRPLYLGVRRGPKPFLLSARKNLPLVEARDGELALSGEWVSEPDALRTAGGTAKMLSIYRGAEALAVLSHPGRKPQRVFVKQDNLWLHTGNAGADIRWDADDRSYVEVTESRLYALARNRRPGLRSLEFSTEIAGLAVHSLEFPDYCQTSFPRPK